MPDGQERDLETGLFSRQDFEAMASAEQDGGGDVEVCKSFLMTKNNARELNIDKLCLVGAEMGATVAIDWAAKDWSWPVLVGAGKQGQFVKALVLLSPQWSFKGMPIAQAVSNRDFASQISWMIVVGEQDSKSLGEAKRMNQSLDRYLPVFAKAQGKPSVDFHPTHDQPAEHKTADSPERDRGYRPLHRSTSRQSNPPLDGIQKPAVNEIGFTKQTRPNHRVLSAFRLPNSPLPSRHHQHRPRLQIRRRRQHLAVGFIQAFVAPAVAVQFAGNVDQRIARLHRVGALLALRFCCVGVD